MTRTTATRRWLAPTAATLALLVVLVLPVLLVGVTALPRVASAFTATTNASGSFASSVLAPPGPASVGATCESGLDRVDIAWGASTSANADGFDVTRQRDGVLDGTVQHVDGAATTTLSQSVDLSTPATWTWEVRTTDGAWRSVGASVTDSALLCP